MKKLSIKGLAKFMTASPYRQRRILRDYKYPSEDEPRAKILYYREARDIIEAYHSGDHEPNWLIEEARHLQDLASLNSGQAKTRLNHNARSLRAYARNFSDYLFNVLERSSLRLEYGDVVITVVPDLYVVERGQEKIVKLEFGVTEPTKRMIKIISQGMFEAAEVGGIGLESKDILFLDVPRGNMYRGARMGSIIRRDIEAACKNIDAIWNRI